MPKIDTESERERLDRIFDEIAWKIKTKEQRHAIYERKEAEKPKIEVPKQEDIYRFSKKEAK